MGDHIDLVTARSPEITGQGGEHNTYADVTKSENSVDDTSRPRQTKTGLSWRTRLAGRATTVNVDELENGEHFSSLSATRILRRFSRLTLPCRHYPSYL